MILDFNGVKARCQIVNETTKPSKHTGSPLSFLEVQTIIRGKNANDDFLSRIDQVRIENVNSIDDGGNVLKKWKVANSSWSYQNDAPIYSHTINLEEVEELNLASLMLGDLELQPYTYREEFLSDDDLMLKAKILLPEAQHNKLKAMQKSSDFIQVVRNGIQEEPKQMKFGLCYWSKHDAGFKHEIVLSEQKGKIPPDSLVTLFKWLRPLRHQVASDKIAINALLTMLVTRGVLTKEDEISIRTEIKEQWLDAQYEFYRVEDVDE